MQGSLPPADPGKDSEKVEEWLRYPAAFCAKCFLAQPESPSSANRGLFAHPTSRRSFCRRYHRDAISACTKVRHNAESEESGSPCRTGRRRTSLVATPSHIRVMCRRSRGAWAQQRAASTPHHTCRKKQNRLANTSRSTWASAKCRPRHADCHEHRKQLQSPLTYKSFLDLPPAPS